MKALRLCLLLLLAVLLPLRGAVAAAMLCPGGQAMQLQLSAAPAGMAMHDHAHMHEHEAQAGQAHHAQPSGELAKCNTCCDFCAMTPLPATEPLLPVAQALANVRYPHLLAPAPSFVSGGQERPPRAAC
ncbi:MAG TPA: DUF2946 family protein [Ideonella sp.]|uniref:DUF2946 family protein n=1 Tax=Ideonella sp. TaxID=1929293 RepID=UPI002CBC85C9|nr:DUF2946 family protein [Ideonella sp.]HSI49992.1 DUF2946 family protein [Ideonella sp.]